MARVRMLFAAAVAGVALMIQAPTWIIYNPSPSVPIGFYIRDHAAPQHGDFVTVRARDVAARYAAERGFDDADDRFIKRVAASWGDHVCARGGSVMVRGATLARQRFDHAGRPLPRWQECRRLRAHEVFLVGDTDDSFDSRYWGPVDRASIEATWRPLFMNEPTLGTVDRASADSNS